MDWWQNGLDYFVSNISRWLKSKEVFDYIKFFKDFLSTLNSSNLTYSQKAKIKEYLREFMKIYNWFEWISAHQKISLSSNFLAANALWDSLDYPDIILHSYHITDEHWNVLNAYWINKFSHFWLIYRWWVARIIARVVLWLPYNPNESWWDVDLYIAKELLPQKLSIANQFNTWIEWIKVLDKFTIDHVAKDLKTVDCSINQLAADNHTLYITDFAINSLRNWIIFPTQYGESLYWISSKNIDWKVVFFPRVLYRLMKFVIEWKANWFEIDAHNINLLNLELLWIDNYVILLVRKFSAKSLWAQLHMYWRMQKLFRIIWIIWPNQSLFDYLKYLFVSEKNDESWSEIIDKEQFEANWLLHKLIKLLKTKISENDLLEWYNFDDNWKKVVSLNISYYFDATDWFRSEFTSFLKFLKEKWV